MPELTTILSSDINVITAEINSYKQIAGHAIFEIGRRLKHVRDSLRYGEYDQWCKESLGFTRSTANKSIQAFEQFGNDATSRQLDVGKIFEMLSLPSDVDRADFVSTPHTIPSTGATKTVDEMTVRELREVKAALKSAEEQRDREAARANKAESDYEAVRDTLESVTSEPLVQTEYVRDSTLEERLRRYEERFGDIGTYEAAALRIPNATDVSASVQTFAYEVRTLLKKYAYLTQYERELTVMTGVVREDYESTIDALDRFSQELRDAYGNRRSSAKIINI